MCGQEISAICLLHLSRASEYLLAHTLSGIAKAVLVFVLDAVIATIIFHFNIYQEDR